MGLVYLQMMQSRQGSAFMQPVPQFGDGPATMEEIRDRFFLEPYPASLPTEGVWKLDNLKNYLMNEDGLQQRIKEIADAAKGCVVCLLLFSFRFLPNHTRL